MVVVTLRLLREKYHQRKENHDVTIFLMAFPLLFISWNWQAQHTVASSLPQGGKRGGHKNTHESLKHSLVYETSRSNFEFLFLIKLLSHKMCSKRRTLGMNFVVMPSVAGGCVSDETANHLGVQSTKGPLAALRLPRGLLATEHQMALKRPYPSAP